MFKKVVHSFVLAVCVLGLNGCIFLAAGAAGAGTAVWLSEKVTQEVNVPRDRVVGSAKNALKNMKMNIYKESKSTEVTQILVKNSDGRQVWVDIRPIDAKNTRVDVRVGYLNGEADARKILEQIVKTAQGLF